MSSVATIVVDNPSKRNALDDETRRKLLGDLSECMRDPDLHALVICGRGGNFCAGGDLGSMPTKPALIRRRLGEMHDIVRLIVHGPKPVVAAVEGAAYGSGLALAAACDYVVAGRGARFGCAFLEMGLVPDTGLLWTLERRLGHRVRLVALEARTLTAEAAAGLGIVDLQVDEDQAVDAALQWAHGFVGRSREAVAGIRRLSGISPADLDVRLREEMACQIELLGSAHFRKARAEFLSRRLHGSAGSSTKEA